MSLTLGFDIYGTLIDPHAVVVQLSGPLGDRAVEFSQIWRQKQLEYSFRRGLMRQYENFETCTRDALEYTDSLLKTQLDDATRQELLHAYRELPAYEEVKQSLQVIADRGDRIVAFSNGTAETVSHLLRHAEIDRFFDAVVSVDTLKTFKPNPDVYHHLVNSTGSRLEQCWLVSSNPFDVVGAVAAGLKAAWLKRSPDAVFDPGKFQPNLTISSLTELVDRT